jgi:serine/threonine protein kinase
VCEGVQHAHQKAILHRDLKPSNILVSGVDGKPAPRIIDFGVAKATAQRLTDSAGTDVDTRADVYSLGAVLYELTGALPLDFHKIPPDEFLRRLREEDAPSTAARSCMELARAREILDEASP